MIIKWIRARLYHGHEPERLTGHVFECGSRSISIKNLKEGRYPPFDCLELTLEDAIVLRNFLDESIAEELR